MDSKIIGYDCVAFGCAFWIDQLEHFSYRFHCYDHDYDDDFDDLVFDCMITHL